MAISNTKDCFRECVGKRVKGVLFHESGGKTLIFEDRSGLAFGTNGSFWLESATTIQREINRRQDELKKTKTEIEEVLALMEGDNQ